MSIITNTTIIVVTLEVAGMAGGAARQPGITRVVVPLDGSELSRTALTPAIELASRSGATVELLTTKVADGPTEPTSFLDDLADEIAGERPDGVDLETIVRIERDPVEALEAVIDEAEGATLVVMSSHGRGRVGRAVLGSTAEQLVAGGLVPVAVIGPEFDADSWDPAGPVMIAHDGEHDPDLGIIEAVARTAGGRVVIVEVASKTASALHRHSSDAPVSDAVAACEGRLQGMGFDVTSRLCHGLSIANTILDEAADVGASSVVTTSRASGVRRAALGSVASSVVKSSPVPVLISRAR